MAWLLAAGGVHAAEPAGPAETGAVANAPAVAGRAEGGFELVRALGPAERVAVGTVRSPQRLDLSGYAADLEVERVLAGVGKPGETLRFAWEELARSRPARFSEGDRILVALATLPAGSLWRQRFPQGGLVVAAEGAGFLRDPDPATLDRLAAFLAVEPRKRHERRGVEALAGLVEDSDPKLATGALRELAGVPGLDGRLDEAATASLGRALEAGRRPIELQREILGLVASRELRSLLPAARQHTAPGDPLEAPSLEAVAALSGGLPDASVRHLLGRKEAAVRAAAARGARGETLDAVAPLVVKDPAAEVRLAAVRALVAAKGERAFEPAAAALFDPDAMVRGGAATALAGLGASVVPRLEALLAGRSMPQAGSVLGALVLSGDAGRAVVVRIAKEHEDPAVRAAAALALGRPPSDH